MPSGEWWKVWIYLSFAFGCGRCARPRFDTSTDMGMVLVPQDAEVDSVIFRLRATDQDADFPLVFDITATITPVVRIENLPCTLYNKICQANVILTRRLTAGRLHDFAVRVRDSKGDYNTMQATISVTNATTQRDKIFPHIPAIIMVPEDTKPGKELDYVLVRANPWSGKPVYVELWQPKELFTIRQRQTPTQTRGIITLIGELDFETQSMYTLTLYATDPYTEPQKDTRNIAGLHLVVIVQDVQDVPPIFTHAPPLTKLNNTIQPGDMILRVHAEDGDKGVPREVTYGLVSEGNPFTPFFNISETTGEITLARPLEELTLITHVGAPVVLSVVAEEIRRSPSEPPAQATVVEVGLLLGEPGNSPPYFENENYVAWMDENADPGTMVVFTEPYSTRVKDEDVGKAGVFALKLENNNGTFEISPTVAERSANFIISVRDNSMIDYEVHKSLRFKIVAQEVGPATNLSASVPVTIFLRDVNDNAPEFQEESYEVTLSENVTAGTRVVQVQATDKDTGAFGRIQYTQIIGPGSEAFIINPDTGVISVTMSSNKLLDREMTAQLQLTVEARDDDGKGLRGTVPFIVNLLDVNDNAPTFEKSSYDFVLNGDFTNFTVSAIIKAIDADAEPPNNIVRYELIHGNYENYFHLNEVTGELFLRKQISKVRSTRQNPYQALSSKFRRTITTLPKNTEHFRNASNTSALPSTDVSKNGTNLQNVSEKFVRRKRQDSNKDVLFTLTARAYDLGVPHMSSITQVNILQSPLAAARLVMFVVPGENPDPAKTAQTLATITGGRITVQEIRPYVPGTIINGYDTTLPDNDGSKRSIVIARVEPATSGTSVVDIEKIRAALAANGVGVIAGDMPDPRNGSTSINTNNTITTVQSEEVTVYRAENKLLFWLLIILGLLILAAIIALIVCCVCPGCPFYMAPRKRRIHSSETLIARSDGRPRRHLHRKHPNLMQGLDPSWSGKKQAWSADPTQSHWQFNRRNVRNYGQASLPGDVIRMPDPRYREYPRKAMSLRGDSQIPIPVIDPSRRHDDHRIYMEDMEARARYEQDMDSLRRHELERGSDRHLPIDARREQHYYRDGNAEVMRLVTRRGMEETQATMHRPPEIVIDQVNRVDGKDILLRRFIEDQKLRVDREYTEALQDDFERQSMESHQRQREISMAQQMQQQIQQQMQQQMQQQRLQEQIQQEILLIPDKLETDHRQHIEELGPDVQRLIIDHGMFDKAGRSDESQDILTGATLLIPMAKPQEKPKEMSHQGSSVNLQQYTMHDLELAKQNVLLTRLLLERDGRAPGGLLDPASYLETQSLPGQVAAGTQTDQTAATQTEYHHSRSRSDNESEEESRIRKKKRYGEEPKRIRTLWMRSPIEEEERQYSGKRSMLLRRKMRDIKDGRKSSIEPEVLREISDSLDENGEELPDTSQKQFTSSNSQYESREEEIVQKEDSSSMEMIKEDYPEVIEDRKPEREEKRKKVMKGKQEKEKDKEQGSQPPSFRILEKEMTSLSKKLSKLTGRKVSSEEDSGEKEKVPTKTKIEKTKMKEREERKAKKIETKSKRRVIQEAIQSVAKEHLKIPVDTILDKTKLKSKSRKVLPISTASSDWEESIERSKIHTKPFEVKKLKAPKGKEIHPKLRRQAKLEKREYKKTLSSEKLTKSETESGAGKMSSSEREKPKTHEDSGMKIIKEVVKTSTKFSKDKESPLKSSGSSTQVSSSEKEQIQTHKDSGDMKILKEMIKASTKFSKERESPLKLSESSPHESTKMETMEMSGDSEDKSETKSVESKKTSVPEKTRLTRETLKRQKQVVVTSPDMSESSKATTDQGSTDQALTDKQSTESSPEMKKLDLKSELKYRSKRISEIESKEDMIKQVSDATVKSSMDFGMKEAALLGEAITMEATSANEEMIPSPRETMDIEPLSADEPSKPPSPTKPIIETIKESVEEKVDSVVDKSKEVGSKVVDSAKSVAGDVKETIKESIVEPMVETKDRVKEFIGTAISKIVEKDKDKGEGDTEPSDKLSAVESQIQKEDDGLPSEQSDSLQTSEDKLLTDIEEMSKSQLSEEISSADTLLPSSVPSIDTATTGETTERKVEMPKAVDIKISTVSEDAAKSPSNAHLTISTQEVEEAQSAKEGLDPSEFSSLDTASVKSEGSQSTKSVTVIRETSFLNSPRRRSPTKNEDREKEKEEEIKAQEMAEDEASKKLSDQSQDEKQQEMKSTEGEATLQKSEEIEKITEPSTLLLPEPSLTEMKAIASTSDNLIPEVNIKAPTPEIESEEQKPPTPKKDHPEMPPPVSRPQLPELSLEMLDDDSDLSSESSTRTTYIAQPYGTPRQRKLIRSERIDDGSLELPSTSLEVPDQTHDQLAISSRSPLDSEESDRSVEEPKTSRYVGKGQVDKTEGSQPETSIGMKEAEEKEIERKLQEESETELEPRDEKRTTEGHADERAIEVGIEKVDSISKLPEAILSDADGSTSLPDAVKAITSLGVMSSETIAQNSDAIKDDGSKEVQTSKFTSQATEVKSPGVSKSSSHIPKTTTKRGVKESQSTSQSPEAILPDTRSSKSLPDISKVPTKPDKKTAESSKLPHKHQHPSAFSTVHKMVESVSAMQSKKDIGASLRKKLSEERSLKSQEAKKSVQSEVKDSKISPKKKRRPQTEIPTAIDRPKVPKTKRIKSQEVMKIIPLDSKSKIPRDRSKVSSERLKIEKSKKVTSTSDKESDTKSRAVIAIPVTRKPRKVDDKTSKTEASSKSSSSEVEKDSTVPDTDKAVDSSQSSPQMEKVLAAVESVTQPLSTTTSVETTLPESSIERREGPVEKKEIRVSEESQEHMSETETKLVDESMHLKDTKDGLSISEESSEAFTSEQTIEFKSSDEEDKFLTSSEQITKSLSDETSSRSLQEHHRLLSPSKNITEKYEMKSMEEHYKLISPSTSKPEEHQPKSLEDHKVRRPSRSRADELEPKSLDDHKLRRPSKSRADELEAKSLEDFHSLPTPSKSARHPKEEPFEPQSRYMAWYKEMQERREGEGQDEPPKWLRKSTRQRWLKMTPEDRKAFDLRTPELTPLTRRKIKPLVNVESEQLKAIIRQGRRLRRAEGGKSDDPQIEIFAPEKPPPPLIPQPPPKYHYLIQHSEYKYEKIPPFYLHPPPVPHPSPQISPQHFDTSIEMSRRPDEDMDSGIVMSMSTGGRLRHQQLLEKKSVFDIAYSEAAPSQLRTDSTTPPS